MFCIKCGKKILANDRYCQYCGEKIDGTEEPQNIKQTNLVQDEKSKKLKLSKNTWKPALIIIAVLGFFTWAYFANESDPNANQNLVMWDYIFVLNIMLTRQNHYLLMLTTLKI